MNKNKYKIYTKILSSGFINLGLNIVVILMFGQSYINCKDLFEQATDSKIVGQNVICLSCSNGTICHHKSCSGPNCSVCCAGCPRKDFFIACCNKPKQDTKPDKDINQNIGLLNQNCNPYCYQNYQTLGLTYTPRTIFIPRSQGSNAARLIVGWQPFFHKPVPDSGLLVTAHTLSYTQSFRPQRIADYLFGTTTLTFTGSSVPNRTRCQVLADSFGLCPNFVGTLNINPVIQNLIFENQFFFSLNSVYPGLYITVNLPLVHTRWSLNGCAKSQTENCEIFPPCTMSDQAANGTKNLLLALSGNFLFGDMQTPFQFGKFTNQTLTLTKFANVNFIFGHDLWQDPQYYFGWFLELIAPTGNRPCSRFVFEPIVGNSHHWEFGGGVTGNLPVWGHGSDQRLILYIDAHVTHMFKTNQCRSFDFCSRGPLSRYSLLQEFDQDGIYTGRLINGINFATRPVTVSRTVKGDLVFKLAYYDLCTYFDIGYNFYGHTSENLYLDNTAQTKFKYAFKSPDICTQTVKNKFLDDSDLALATGTSPTNATHKVFAHIEYFFPEHLRHRYFMPYIGLGGELEVNALACNQRNNSLNQWGLWLKGGFSF